jgi:hypothetical protein
MNPRDKMPLEVTPIFFKLQRYDASRLAPPAPPAVTPPPSAQPAAPAAAPPEAAPAAPPAAAPPEAAPAAPPAAQPASGDAPQQLTGTSNPPPQ